MPPGYGLARSGFPGDAFLGMATLIPRPVTSRMSTQQTVLMPQPGQDIYSTNQMSWPQREKTMAFNQALNNWLEVIRANRDDWCTIIHSDIEATRLSLKTCLGQLS